MFSQGANDGDGRQGSVCEGVKEVRTGSAGIGGVGGGGWGGGG